MAVYGIGALYTGTEDADVRAHFNQPHRTPTPDDAHVHAPLRPPDEWLSKKVENQEAAAALHFMHHNFARVHQTLLVARAMEGWISDHVWKLQEIVNLPD